MKRAQGVPEDSLPPEVAEPPGRLWAFVGVVSAFFCVLFLWRRVCGDPPDHTD